MGSELFFFQKGFEFGCGALVFGFRFFWGGFGCHWGFELDALGQPFLIQAKEPLEATFW